MYSEDTKLRMKVANEYGFNVYMMLNLYKRHYKINIEIPEDAVVKTCNDCILRGDRIMNKFAYFRKVLTMQIQDSIARRNIEENNKLKKEPWKVKITLG